MRYSWIGIFLAGALFSSDNISGFWKMTNDDSGVAKGIVAIYEYDGLYYGRIIGTYDEKGKMTDTIYTPKEKAPGVIGEPFYCGLDFIWGLVDAGVKFKGKILDPEHGKIYNSECWINEDGNLIVRGKLFVFGQNFTWPPALAVDFPKDFKVPDLAEFVPEVPEPK